MYNITYTSQHYANKLHWPRMNRKNTLTVVRDLFKVFDGEGSLIIYSSDSERYWIHCYLYEREFDIHRHMNGNYSTIYGNSYKTLVGALNKLDKLAAADRH